jgi:hypothetical protein
MMAAVYVGRIKRRRLLRVYHLQQLLVGSVLTIVLLALVVSGQDTKKTSDNNNDGDNNNLLHWQRCSVFIAPSLPTTTDNNNDDNNNNNNDNDNDNVNFNWGVYANRNFFQGEIVDISPLTLPLPDGSDAIERSILNDYVYGYWRVVQQSNNANANTKRPTIDKLYSVLFGPDMFYNHHPTKPNVEFTTFGREPDTSTSSISSSSGAGAGAGADILLKNTINIQGFVALRNIERGEELFTSYNGKEDGGEAWFRRRGIKMITPQSQSKSSSISISKTNMFDLHSNQYCSKIFSGVGKPSYQDRLLPILPKNYDLPFSTDIKLPNFDAGLWDAKTKIDNIKKGDRLEISTALVLSLELTRNTSIMPLVYAWKDLHDEHRSSLKRLHIKDNELRLQYQGPDTNWTPMNNFTTTKAGTGTIPNYDDLVLFPVAGNIGMVRRRTATPTIDAHTSGGGGGGDGGATSTSSDDAKKPNCRLVVHPVVNNHDDNHDDNNSNDDDDDDDDDNYSNNNNNNNPSSFLEHPVGVTIELIAMDDIMIAGTDLIVDVFESVATSLEYKLLYRELKLTGQPYNKQIFQHWQKQQQRRRNNINNNNKSTSASSSSSSSSSTTTTTTTTTIPAKEEL